MNPPAPPASARYALPTPLGKLWLCLREGQPVAIDWADNRERLQRNAGPAGPAGAVEDAAASALLERLRRYFEGALDALQGLPLPPGGSAFQRAVWTATAAIPAGEVRSYAGLAESLGRPGSARAVATALAANPCLLWVPCHRVVGSDGRLAGYAAGVERKRWLLEHEGHLARLGSGASALGSRVQAPG
ncbi:MAG: methylated-DNA--[protein]-cysteine S-methyltransferase [Aquimonas sp.]|nr:methylated-DNA--[protein]-cysteine S-methyltransferase [Aquimonas sp.]